VSLGVVVERLNVDGWFAKCLAEWVHVLVLIWLKVKPLANRKHQSLKTRLLAKMEVRSRVDCHTTQPSPKQDAETSEDSHAVFAVK